MKILVVDDQTELLKAIGLVLESLGCTPVLALRGQAALERMENESFDLILCDVQMPGIDGKELFRRLQNRKMEIVPRFLFMSGTAISLELEKELGLETIEFLRKPFDAQTLKAALRLQG